MSLETHVEGDPGACRRTARRLDALGDAAEQAATGLARRTTLSVADFDGMSGDAFRTHARQLGARLEDDARRCRRLSQAMGHLADDLDALLGLMGQVRDRARAGGLRVDGETVLEPGPESDGADTWRELVAFVGDLRDFEDRAQRAWQDALLRETSGSGPGGGRPDRPVPTATDPEGSRPAPAPASASPPASAPTAGAVPAPTGPAGAGLPPGPWRAEEVGAHAERWPGAGQVGFEEVRDGSQ